MRRIVLRALLPLMVLVMSACNLALNGNAAVEVTATDIPPTPAEGIPVGTPFDTSCTITTTVATELQDVPGNWGQMFAGQGAGITMPVLAISSNGWYKVPFGGDGGTMAEAYINPKDVTVAGDCSGVETFEVWIPLTDCKVTNNTGSSQILHAKPELVDGNLTGRIQPGETLGVIKSQGSWFQVYSEAIGNSAWVERRLVSANDQCANI